MPTPSEKRALVFLSAVLTLGAGVRATKALSAEPPPPSAAARADLHRQILAVDSADSVERISGGKRHRSKRPTRIGISTSDGSDAAVPADSSSGRKRRKTTKILPQAASQPRTLGASPGGPIDLDRAQEWEILSLPKVGPSLAHRIIANRDSLGPFGSLDELRRIKGIGEGVVNAITPYVTFSLQPRQSREKERDGVAPRRTDKRRRRPSPSP
ncbi:MAG: helix-hairpin-helix domain-containing protein [Gemmatimonadaceae bacterium]|nr:helix-hairpin-helix domain-containing protein [Gemmatimonadaceae bacterium]